MRNLHGDVLVLPDGVDQFPLLGGTPPCGLDQDPERLARLLRCQGLRLEVALLEEDQTLELNHTGNSQKANLRMYKESELHSRLSETENLTGVASRGRKLQNTSV